MKSPPDDFDIVSSGSLDHSVWDGWMRYWGTFRRGWRVVLGFALAIVVSDLMDALLRGVWHWLWHR